MKSGTVDCDGCVNSPKGRIKTYQKPLYIFIEREREKFPILKFLVSLYVFFFFFYSIFGKKTNIDLELIRIATAH